MIAYELGVYSAGADTLTVYPVTAAAGDQLVALITWAISGVVSPVPPAGWTELDRKSTATHHWAVFAHDVSEALTGASLVWTAATTVAAGVVVVYRGGQVGLVEFIDAMAVVDVAAGTQHAFPTLAVGTTQGSDRLLIVQWLLSAGAVTAADPALSYDGVELLASYPLLEGTIVAFEGSPRTIGEQGDGPTTQSSPACNSTSGMVALRSRALVRGAAVMDAQPGHIGLLP
ncbi:MAG: hypothetical protein M3R63_18545 [Actinomycetota bacterium]|nr:hypothetical protein [Actinomycetota bacterium]